MILIKGVICWNCSWEVPNTSYCLNCGKPLNTTHDTCFCGKELYHGRHKVKGKLAWRCACGFSATTKKELKAHLELANHFKHPQSNHLVNRDSVQTTT